MEEMNTKGGGGGDENEPTQANMMGELSKEKEDEECCKEKVPSIEERDEKINSLAKQSHELLDMLRNKLDQKNLCDSDGEFVEKTFEDVKSYINDIEIEAKTSSIRLKKLQGEKQVLLKKVAESTLNMEHDLKSRVGALPTWQIDTEHDECSLCQNAFTFFNRRHHCRNCGVLVDSACSNNFVTLARLGYLGKQRVCNKCFNDMVSSKSTNKHKKDVDNKKNHSAQAKGVFKALTKQGHTLKRTSTQGEKTMPNLETITAATTTPASLLLNKNFLMSTPIHDLLESGARQHDDGDNEDWDTS